MIQNFNSTGLLAPQVEHAKTLCYSLITNNISWDASGTGQGKTYVAASILRHLGTKFVVICPKLNIPKWAKVLTEFGLTAEFILNYEKIARGNLKKIYRYKTKGQKGIPHFLRGEFKMPTDWTVICDESHRSKGIETLSAGLLYALKNQGYRIHCCSATQAMTVLDMRAFGYATNLHQGMNVLKSENYGMRKFKQFAIDSGAKPVGKWGALYVDPEDAESKEKFQAVNDNLFNVQKIGSRMNREDFGDIFPNNQIDCSAYDMGENGRRIQRVYDDMEAELARLEDRCENYKEHIFAVLIKARRMAELLKVPSLIEMATELYDENKSTVIFVNFTDTIESLYKRLSEKFGADKIGQIHGEQTFKQRFDDIEAFQTDKKRIIIANTCAGGESIDLHDITGNHPRASLINPSYRSISVVQSIGRIDRANALSDCLTRLVLANGTIENSVADKFNMKKNNLDILNDGDIIPDGKYFRLAAGMNV